MSFAKTGSMGGHIKVTGNESCEQDLGANAEPGRRRHATLGFKSPMQFEVDSVMKKQAA